MSCWRTWRSKMRTNGRGVSEADAALAIAPDALDAMAIHAAVDLLADKNAAADAWFAKIKAVNPGYGEGYAMVAQQLEMHYRYEDADVVLPQGDGGGSEVVVGALGSWGST